MTLYQKLKEVIEGTNTKVGRLFDLLIQSLVLLSIITFSIETLPNLSLKNRTILHYIEIMVVSIFTIEYILRLFVADKKLKFIFSWSAIIDLVAILPFYLSTGIDLRSLRIFRLFRIARIFKFVRFVNAIEHFRLAFNTIKDELKVFGISMLFILYLSAVGIYYFENPVQPEAFSSVFHSLWWSVTTLTTVGYGDMYPVTTGGKFFTFIVLLIGLGIVAVPTGLISTALAETTKQKLNSSD